VQNGWKEDVLVARLNMLDPETTKGWNGRLLKKVAESLGAVPNMFKAMGNSAMALDGFLTLNGNLGQGKLGGDLIKMIILATSELNGCEYCVSAHTQMAKDANLLTEEQCLAARRLEGTDDRSTAVLKFVKSVWDTKGKVDDAAVKAVRDAGLGDEEIVEVLGVMALSTNANYVSNVGELDMDFPEAPPVA
jgi:uncharacterized peroxidase-related enzyme